MYGEFHKAADSAVIFIKLSAITAVAPAAYPTDTVIWCSGTETPFFVTESAQEVMEKLVAARGLE